MDQQPLETTEIQPKKTRRIQWKWLIIAVLIIATGVLGWLLFQSHQREKVLTDEKSKLQHSLETLSSELALQNQGANTSNDNCSGASESLKNNINAALNSKRSDLFTSYVSEKTRFTVAGSEKDEEETPEQVALSMAITENERAPWNFEIDSTTLDNYRGGPYGAHFQDGNYIGKSVTGMVVSFGFECDGKIKSIFISPNDSLL